MYGKYSVLNSDSYQRELKQLNKKIYNKRHRLAKNYGVQLDVENRKMEDFRNKREFDKWKKEVLNMSDRNANIPVKNAKGTEMELDYVKKTKKLIDQANRQKRQRLEHYMKQPFKDRGQDTGFTLDQVEYGFQSEKFGSLQPTEWNPDRFNTEKELIDFYNQKSEVYGDGFLKKRDQQYQNNYVKSLLEVFGEDGKELAEHIQNMTSDDFIDLYYTENLMNIEFVYSRRDAQIKLDTLSKQFSLN